MRRLESKPARSVLALLLCTVHICVGVILTFDSEVVIVIKCNQWFRTQAFDI